MLQTCCHYLGITMKFFIQERTKWKQFLFTSNTMKESDVDTCAHLMTTMNKDHLYYRKTWIELLIIGSTWLFYYFQSDPFSMVPWLISTISNFYSKPFRSAKLFSRPPSFHKDQLCFCLVSCLSQTDCTHVLSGIHNLWLQIVSSNSLLQNIWHEHTL